MRILVVDDEAKVREICERVLRRAGYDVYTTGSGDQALLLLQEGWDIILTDISMPGSINGIRLLTLAKARGTTDVLIMTANPELDTAVQAMREGAYDYLIKPLTQDTLLLAIKRCDEKRRLSVELAREKQLRDELKKAYRQLTSMERVKKTFGQFVTPEVLDFVLRHPSDFWKRGERKTVTILFADVRQFTPYTSAVSPEEVVEVLNTIFACVTEAIQMENGIVNKFIGDGMLAIFGAPVPDETHATSAARGALRAMEAVEALAQTRHKEGDPPLRIGIGVNTGEVVAGCLGTKARTEYSVIGHAVNLASRLQSVAEAGQILLGPDTTSQLPDTFQLGRQIPLLLKGVSEPILASELLDEKLVRNRSLFK